MSVFMVERSLKGISMDDLGAAQKAAISTASEMTKRGTPVRYIRSTFVPESGSCMCLFDAESAASVKALNEKAKLPFDRIVPALDLTP
ncbi:MAG TPA: DUF4242 domain-containing protein [Usitatibacter sp.]|nr:DUF4242 domain-containing protein [Usitatibacter sp.]